MRKITMFILVMMLALSACSSSGQLKPIKEETIEFDLATASKMVKEKEKLIIDVAFKDSITLEEYETYKKLFNEAFGEHGERFLFSWIRIDENNEVYLHGKSFYPTVFHQGVDITGAVVYKSYYENEFFNRTSLRITVEYLGDDAKLKGWKRAYIFTENNEGKWELDGFSGKMNFTGEGFDMNYLELKE